MAAPLLTSLLLLLFVLICVLLLFCGFTLCFSPEIEFLELLCFYFDLVFGETPAVGYLIIIMFII